MADSRAGCRTGSAASTRTPSVIGTASLLLYHPLISHIFSSSLLSSSFLSIHVRFATIPLSQTADQNPADIRLLSSSLALLHFLLLTSASLSFNTLSSCRLSLTLPLTYLLALSLTFVDHRKWLGTGSAANLSITSFFFVFSRFVFSAHVKVRSPRI
jgi:hypothetical protein